MNRKFAFGCPQAGPTNVSMHISLQKSTSKLLYMSLPCWGPGLGQMTRGSDEVARAFSQNGTLHQIFGIQASQHYISSAKMVHKPQSARSSISCGSSDTRHGRNRARKWAQRCAWCFTATNCYIARSRCCHWTWCLSGRQNAVADRIHASQHLEGQ
jgi:hypothetical protein